MDAIQIITLLLISGWIVWGLLPSRQVTASNEEPQEPSVDCQTGLAVGMLDGDVGDAAAARYAVSRREADGHTITTQDILTAAMIQSGVPDQE
jgi:hypothetical protein